MRQFIKRYLNEIVSLAVLVMMVIAFVDGQVLGDKAPGANAPGVSTIVVEQARK